MWRLQAGSLRLEGLDLIVLDQENPRSDRLAVASLLPDTQLTMIDCSLSVAVRRTLASAFVLQAPADSQRTRSTDPMPRRPAVITLQDCLLRSGGDAVTVVAGRELSLDMTNVLAATDGSLVHAMGSLRRQPLDPAAIDVRLKQVMARVKGGLVHLETTPDEPELRPSGSSPRTRS